MTDWSWRVWASVLFLAVCGTALCFTWFADGVRLMGAARASAFINLVPVFAVLQAAVLLGKLPHLAGWSAARRARAARYTEAFAGLAAICPPRTDPANEHIFHQYTVRAERRDQLVEHLKAQGIGCAVYYPLALHLQPCFAHLGFGRGSLPVTEAAMGSVVASEKILLLTASNFRGDYHFPY